MKLDINDKHTQGQALDIPAITTMNNDEDIIGTMDAPASVHWYRVKFDYDGKANFYTKLLYDGMNIDMSLYKGDPKTLVGFSGNGPGSHEVITIYNAEKDVEYFLKVENKGRNNICCMKYLARCRIYPYILKNLSVKKYQQQDIRWGYKSLDCKGSTMRTDGCYVTCGAMVLGETPGKHYDYLKNKGISNCPYPVVEIADAYGMKYENQGKRDGKNRFEFLKTRIFYYIYVRNIPVIVRLSGSKGTHFLVVIGFDGNMATNKKALNLEDIKAHMFKVNDPGYIDNKTLADSIDKGYENLTHIEVMY